MLFQTLNMKNFNDLQKITCQKEAVIGTQYATLSTKVLTDIFHMFQIAKQ